MLPKMFIFDLDDTLLRFYGGQRSTLSRSADNVVCRDVEGYTTYTSKGVMHDVRAIAREKIKAVFDKAYTIMHTAGRLYHPPIIAIKIISSALYPQSKVITILDEFYSPNASRFFMGHYPIEYFNRNSYEKESDWVSDERTCSKKVDRSKVNLIWRHFPRWQEELPGLIHKNVYLIDNADFNILPVQDAGFSALHYPTTIEERDHTVSYAEASEKIFSQLNAILDEMSEYLQTEQAAQWLTHLEALS